VLTGLVALLGVLQLVLSLAQPSAVACVQQDGHSMRTNKWTE